MDLLYKKNRSKKMERFLDCSQIKISESKFNNISKNYLYYFLVLSTLVVVALESVFTMLVSVAAAEAIAESEGAVTIVVESVVVVSVEVESLPPQAVKKAATVKTSNNFFIV